jgi:hypothetical protein
MVQKLSVEHHAGVVILGTTEVSMLEISFTQPDTDRVERVQGLLQELSELLNDEDAKVLSSQFKAE